MKPIDMVRPSGSHIWHYCHGSQAMQSGLPEDDSDAAKQGTACHWIASEILLSFMLPSAGIKTTDDFLNTLAFNNVYIDEEMLEGVMLYVNYILDYCNKHGTLKNLHIEETMNIDGIYPAMTGTPDCWIYNPVAMEVILIDLKYGHGWVDEFENPQLMIYMKAIMDFLLINGITDQSLTLKMVIVQPRGFGTEGPIREWSIKGSDLRGYVNQLKTSANIAMRGEGDCTPGTHCRYCLARNSCKALQKSVYNAIDVVTGISQTNLSGNDLAFELHLLKRAEAYLDYRITAIESQAELEMKAGKLLPGFSLQQGYGREKWKKNSGHLKFMSSMGVDIVKPDVYITPKQALAKLKAAYKKLNVVLDESVISKYTETPLGKMKVIEDKPNAIKKIFSKRNK